MIYFIKPIGYEGPIKIGYTSRSPKTRLRDMQTGSPLPLEVAAFAEGTMSVEKRLQFHFQKYHSHGEWFFSNPELLNMIDSIKRGDDALREYRDEYKGYHPLGFDFMRSFNDMAMNKWKHSQKEKPA